MSQATNPATNPAMSARDRYQEQFERSADALPGNNLAWMQRLRREGLSRFAELGFPTPRDEDWKYTSVAAIEKASFDLALRAGKVTLQQQTLLGLTAHRLVFVDGHYAPGLSQVEGLPPGVIVESLAGAMQRCPQQVEPHLGRYADATQHAFTALNLAFATDGAFVYLPRGAAPAEPIHLIFLTSPGAARMVHPRNLVVAEDSSAAVIIESYEGSADSGYFTNAVTEVVAGPNAAVEHYKLQQEGAKAFHIATLQVQQARDSRFTSHSISLGGLLTRNDINAWLNAEGVECTLNGLYLAGGRQHMDYHTRIDHAKPHGSSRELYKGVLDGRARGVFNGRVIVHPDAQKTDAQQINKNLLLSEDAEVDPKPQLEIFADDVKCSHGATVGTLDTEALFYLRSRGIPTEVARTILIYAFANDVIERIKLVPMRQQLEASLLARLPQGERMQELTRAHQEAV